MSESPPAILPLFRSAQQLKLLGFLYINSGNSYSLAQLETATGIPQQTTSREVERLTTAGIVTSSQLGRMRMVSANEHSPIYRELRGLLLKAVGPLPLLTEQLATIQNIHEAYIFGSWAKRYLGESGAPPKDIDVVVIGDPDPDEIFEAARTVEGQLGMEVNPVIVSRDDWRRPSGFTKRLKGSPRISVKERPPHGR